MLVVHTTAAAATTTVWGTIVLLLLLELVGHCVKQVWLCVRVLFLFLV